MSDAGNGQPALGSERVGFTLNDFELDIVYKALDIFTGEEQVDFKELAKAVGDGITEDALRGPWKKIMWKLEIHSRLYAALNNDADQDTIEDSDEDADRDAGGVAGGDAGGIAGDGTPGQAKRNNDDRVADGDSDVEEPGDRIKRARGPEPAPQADEPIEDFVAHEDEEPVRAPDEIY